MLRAAFNVLKFVKAPSLKALIAIICSFFSTDIRTLNAFPLLTFSAKSQWMHHSGIFPIFWVLSVLNEKFTELFNKILMSEN
jgi:hypothetical protein